MNQQQTKGGIFINNHSEYIGKQFEQWLILSIAGKKGTNTTVNCKCLKCNKTEKTLVLTEIKRGKTSMCKSCANTGKQLAKDKTGQRFGKLTVLKRIENKGKKVYWLCVCDCGEKVIKRTNDLNKIKDDQCHHNIYQNQGKNKYIINENYVKGYTRDNKEFLFDLEDYEEVIKYTWYDGNGYIRTDKDKRLLHRLIMNPKKNEVVDHINGNTYDNRKSNLRICTDAENTRNSKLNSNNKSGHRGVYFSKGKWVAYITKDYKKMRIGSYINIEEAIEARLKAEIELFGEFSPSLSRNE